MKTTLRINILFYKTTTMRILLLTLSIFYFAIPTTFAQTTTTSGVDAPVIVPKSPEVKALERYGEYPVSEYTGIPSINIPLYNIKLKDIDFPISLDYHAAGIQVTQEATWVGLGWNLLVGGCISTTAMGPVDWASGAIAQPAEWNRFMSYNPRAVASGIPRFFNEEGLKNWGCIVTNGNPADVNINENSRTPEGILNEGLMASGERDVFNISFLGNSFKVSLHPVSGQAVFSGEKNKFKIVRNSPTTWTITDDKGYYYIFSACEYYTSGGNSINCTWHLSEIRYQGITLLKVNYQSIDSKSLPSISETFSTLTETSGSIAFNLPVRTYNYLDTNTKLHVSSIVGPLDSIVFITKTRVDIQSGKALDQIIIYDKNTKSEIKRYALEQDYFTGNSTGAASTTLDYVIKRLRLSKLYEKYGTQNKGLYQFTYNDTALPYKTSFSQDLWGYYNGQYNSTRESIIYAPTSDVLFDKNRTLIPSPVIEGFNELYPTGFTTQSLANRLGDPNFITAGMLKSITYPTGGRTEFEFESHTFNNRTYPPAYAFTGSNLLLVKSILNNGNATFSTPSVTFENETEVKAKIKVTIIGKDYALSQMGSFYVTLGMVGGSKKYSITTTADQQMFNSSKSVTFEEEVTLPVGRVTLTGVVLSGMPYQAYSLNNGVQATLTYQDNDLERLKSYTSVGGGVRVKTITNYSDNNTIASIKTFKYSGGKLINPMRFYMKTTKSYGINHSRYSKIEGILSSNNFYNYVADGYGTVVGYDQVEVETNSVSKDYTTGKIVSDFINKPSKSYFDYFFFPVDRYQYSNGKLSQRVVLNAKSSGLLPDTLRTEKYTYLLENFDSQYISLNVKDLYVGPVNECMNGTNGLVYNSYAYLGRFSIIAYPTNSYTVHLMKKEETDYFGTNKVSKVTDYVYDATNYQEKKVTQTLGDKKQITQYTYGYNFSDMLAQNMYGVVTEETSSVNAGGSDIFVKGVKTAYAAKGTLVVPANVQVKYGSTGTYESRLEYNNYDTFGNPAYITMDEATKIVYIWGYNFQYPIAQITNATYADVTTKIPVATLEAMGKRLVPTTDDWAIIETLKTIPYAMLSTFKYKPSIGVCEMTDSRGVTNYYSYDVFGRFTESYVKENNVKKIIQLNDYSLKNK